MKNSFLIIWLLICSCQITAQSCTGVEQYFYADKDGLALVIPVAYFQNEHNWYVESHINYEQLHTFSVYVGKTFSGNKEFSYSVTPMIGGVLGSLKGGVLGFNTDIKYKRFLFDSQSQYIFSLQNCDVDFLYSWIELGYQMTEHIAMGFSMQHSLFSVTDEKLEAGVYISFNMKKWNFPVYCFNTTNQKRYLILGVTREFSLPVKKINSLELANR